MERRLIVIGDSHTTLFWPFDRNIAAIFHPGPITLDGFCRPNNQSTQQILAFLAAINPEIGTLVLCMSEIDIRAHYWRDFPILISRGMPVEEIVNAKVKRFVQQATAMGKHFGFREVILWGAPASNMPGITEEPGAPTVGDVITRNILTHLLCKSSALAASEAQTIFRFATPFYDMVTDDFLTDTTWLSDGVHIRPEMRPSCLRALAPILAGSTPVSVGERARLFNDHAFGVTTAQVVRSRESSTRMSHLAWVSTPSDAQAAQDDAKPFGFTLTQDISGWAGSAQLVELVLRRQSAENAP